MTHWHISAVVTMSKKEAKEMSKASGFGMTKCKNLDCLRF